MVRVWRISKARFADPSAAAFDGEGSRQFGGRWNSPGRGLAYASSSLALAAMEYFGGLTGPDAPEKLVSVRAEIPRSIHVERLELMALPPDWESWPAPPSLQEIGDRWLDEGTSLALLVPSVFVPQESNCLINPAHPDFKRLRFGSPESFRFNPRLWK